MSMQVNKLLIWIFLFTCIWGILPPQMALLPVLFSLYYMIKVIVVQKPGKYKKAIIIYFVFFIISAFSCLHYEKQSLASTFSSLGCLNLFPVLSYFIFLSGKYSIRNIEKAIVISYITFTICLAIQITLKAEGLFHMITYNDETNRFTMYGQLIAYIGLFYFYGKYLFSNKYKYILYTLPGFILVFTGGYRTQLVAIILALALFTYKVKKIAIIKYIFIFLVFAAVLFQIPTVQSSINNMVSRQISGQTLSNSDYIRVIQLNYFTKEHFKSPVEYVLGSGIPNPTSEYGKPFYTLDPSIGPYNGWPDWGIIGLSWMIGLPAILALLIPIFRIIKHKCNNKIVYIKYLYIFILLSSISTVEFYGAGSFFFHGLLFFLYESYYRQSALKIG